MNHKGICITSGKKFHNFNAINAMFCLVLLMLAAVTLPGSILPPDACAGAVPLSRLVNDKSRYDGQEITIQGEVVGDVMERSTGVWLNVDDGTESIGIWVPMGIMPTIDFVGGYKRHGDIIKVDGIFNRACKVHGGETGIHASEVTRVHPGYPLAHPLPSRRIRWTLLLLIIAVAVIGVHWWRGRSR